jgi:hypothetical protein
MLITFKTKSYADIVMFGEVGKKMLKFMGFGDAVPGAIVKADLPEALQNLRNALDQIPEPSVQQDPGEDEQPEISLRTRALPLIKLLESAIADDNNVNWN